MTCATTTFPKVTSFDGRIPIRGDLRRIVFGGVVISLAIGAAVCVTAALAMTAAAWIVAAALATNPDLQAGVPIGLGTVAVTDGKLAAAAGLGGSAHVLTRPVHASFLMREAEVPRAAPLASIPISAAPLAALPKPAQSLLLPLLPPPIDDPRDQAIQDTAPPPTSPVAPRVAAAALPAAESTSLIPPQAHLNTSSPPDFLSRTAVYDIAAHTVYLPNGARLEAHSGLGDKLDDPRYFNLKNRGPTPPNIYDLTLREQPFHGVRAIRLNPVDDGKMFGRDGILAHTYMLGPSGQSFGCVSFRNYPAFLRAFLKGEVDRLVVVPHQS